MKKPSKRILRHASYYQYVLDGQTFKLNEMDRGQLLRALMNTIDTIESIEGHVAVASDAISRWQASGEPTTDR